MSSSCHWGLSSLIAAYNLAQISRLIFARQYDSLKAIAYALPAPDVWKANATEIPEPLQHFTAIAAHAFNYAKTTGLFDDAGFPQLREIPTDLVNFGFYTCYCFQWTLFENFVKQSVLEAISASLVPAGTTLKSAKQSSEKFFAELESGKLFGHSPFRTALPGSGWNPVLENFDYADLTRIRKLRNQFIHAIQSPAILPSSEREKESLYEKDMWILRKFAENVDQDIRDLRARAASHSIR